MNHTHIPKYLASPRKTKLPVWLLAVLMLLAVGTGTAVAILTGSGEKQPTTPGTQTATLQSQHTQPTIPEATLPPTVPPTTQPREELPTEPAVEPTTEPVTEPTTEPVTEETKKPGKLTFHTKDVTLRYLGESFRLKTGEVDAKDVEWLTDDGQIATVFEGYVTAVGKGTTKIRGRYGDQEVTCIIRCNWTQLKLKESTLRLTEKGKGKQLTLTLQNVPQTVTAKDVKWTTSNSKVATVKDGYVTAVGAGTATITASYGGEKVTCKVTCSISAGSRPKYTAAEAQSIETYVKSGYPYSPDLQALLLKSLDWNLDSGKPTVLIYHTHATETYAGSTGGALRTEDTGKNMIALGKLLKEKLEKAGIQVIHDTGLHDLDYVTAYDTSRKSIKQYLKEYPSIVMTIDLHRDAAENPNGSQVKTTCTVNGKKSAQLMVFAAAGYSKWKQNLALATKLHVQLEREAKGITRPLMLSGKHYNQDLCTGGLLVEVGFAGNTLAEAKVAVGVLAEAIIALKDGAN